MNNLAPLVHAKAIEIANALLAEGHEEGRAIRIAIFQAKRWVRLWPALTGAMAASVDTHELACAARK